MEKIEEYRNKIDEIDSKIIDLLNARAEISFEVKKIKLANDIPILDKSREERIHSLIKSKSNGLLKDDDLERIYVLLLEAMRGIDES